MTATKADIDKLQDEINRLRLLVTDKKDDITPTMRVQSYFGKVVSSVMSVRCYIPHQAYTNISFCPDTNTTLHSMKEEDIVSIDSAEDALFIKYTHNADHECVVQAIMTPFYFYENLVGGVLYQTKKRCVKDIMKHLSIVNKYRTQFDGEKYALMTKMGQVVVNKAYPDSDSESDSD